MGKIPVLAHPERYFCVQDTPELLYEFRKMGAVLQINKGSVFGRFGEEAERTARFLLENRLAGCVDHGHAAGPAVSGGAVWRSVCTAFIESESEKNPGGPSDFL